MSSPRLSHCRHVALASSFLLFPLALSRPDLAPSPSLCYANVYCLFNRLPVILLTNPHTAHYSIVRLRSVACHTYVP